VQIVSYVTLPISTHCEQIIAVHGVNTTGMGISEHVNFFKKRGGGEQALYIQFDKTYSVHHQLLLSSLQSCEGGSL